MARVTDFVLMERLEAYRAAGSYDKAGKHLGIHPENVRRSVLEATRRGLTGEFLGGKMPEGYILGKVTTLEGPDGVVMEWQHKLPESDKLMEWVERWAETLKSELTPLPEILATGQSLEDYLTLYPIADAHLGQFSWGKETGENYDIKIAQQQFLKTTTSLYQVTPPSKTALIVVLGDFFHADNNDATTARHGNHLDVDTRHERVLNIGADLLVWNVDLALQKHDQVIVKVMRGNHDEHSSKALTLGLRMRYASNPRVTVVTDPVDLWSYQFGVNMLSFTHGDAVRAEEMPGAMAGLEPVMWGNTKYRFGYSGHFHKHKALRVTSDEKHGAEWEIILAFTAKDAFNRSRGHASKRGLVAITFDENEGRAMTNYAYVR